MGEVEVRAVKQNDLPGADAGAHLPGAGVVVVPRGVDDRKARQQAVQIEAQVALGGRLSPAVLGPAHAGGDQLNGGGIHDVDRLPKPVGQARALAGAEAWLHAAQVRQDSPEELLRHAGIADLIGMREAVFAGWGCAPNAREPADMMTQAVADVVQADGVGQLAVKQGDHVAPGAEGPGLGFHAVFPGQLLHRMPRDEIAKLSEHAQLGLGWSCPPKVCFFHTRLLPQPANLGNSSRLPRLSEHQISLGLDVGYDPEPVVVADLRDEIAAAWGLPLGQKVEVCFRGERSAVTGTLGLLKAPDFPWDPRQPLKLGIAGLVFSSREIERWTKL